MIKSYYAIIANKTVQSSQVFIDVANLAIAYSESCSFLSDKVEYLLPVSYKCILFHSSFDLARAFHKIIFIFLKFSSKSSYKFRDNPWISSSCFQKQIIDDNVESHTQNFYCCAKLKDEQI